MRHWWPGETAFEVVIGCILTQNTNWTNVEKSIARLKDAGVLTPSGILSLPNDRLIELTRSTGFHTTKPERLRRVTRWWIGHFGNEEHPLHSLELPGLGRLMVGRTVQSVGVSPTREACQIYRDELLALDGVGPETADAILLYALGAPFFVVDAYKRRILARIGLIDDKARYADIQKLFHDALPPDISCYNDFHAQFIQLGKDHCRKTPRCGGCPLASRCDFAQKSDRPALLS